jgi:hypothetical protein
MTTATMPHDMLCLARHTVDNAVGNPGLPGDSVRTSPPPTWKSALQLCTTGG